MFVDRFFDGRNRFAVLTGYERHNTDKSAKYFFAGAHKFIIKFMCAKAQ